MKIILASASPRRAVLFNQMKLSFTVDSSSIVEIVDESLPPSRIVQSLAKQKGEDVAKRHKNAFVVAADTIVCLNDLILGKPESPEKAVRMLNKLSNNTHDVYSGVWAGLTDSNSNLTTSFSFYERTKVTFSALTEQEIDHYVESGSPMDKAGAYGIQDDRGSLFVKKIDGDFYNVVGFPVHSFYQNLKLLMPHIHQTLFFESYE